MDFENKAPKWDAEGTEPSSDLQTKGFQAGYKPPAPYFNWLFNKISKCISELQIKLSSTHTKAENLERTHALTTFTNFSDVGQTLGSETIEGIATNMPNNSIFSVNITTTNNTAIYPFTYGVLNVLKKDNSRVLFEFWYKSYASKYIGFYDETAPTKWTGWVLLADTKSTVDAAKKDGSGNVIADTYATVKALTSHTGNEENPHKVTKEQVGLGNVPNVKTNDQTPTYSDTNTLATLASGEKLNVAFQKIKCAITNLINHLANKENPHGVTAAQVGAAAATDNAVYDYVDLAKCGQEVGSETIEGIATGLPNNSRLFISVGTTHNVAIYPQQYGVCMVTKKDSSRVVFEFYMKTDVCKYIGIYDSTKDVKWTGWQAVLTRADVVDNIDSTNTNLPLSAKQGNALNARIVTLEKNKVSGGAVDLSSSTLEEIVEFVGSQTGRVYAGRFKLSAEHSPIGSSTWFRGVLASQNWANDTNDVGLNIIALSGDNVAYIGNIYGLTTFTLRWQKLLRHGDVVDNLLSTATNLPLSANQGRVLKSEVDKLHIIKNLDVTDLNNITEDGFYWVYTTGKNNVPMAGTYGYLEVKSNGIYQVFKHYSRPITFVRAYVNSEWQSWHNPYSNRLKTSVYQFTDGKCTIPWSYFGFSARPAHVLLTSYISGVAVMYDYDASNDTNLVIGARYIFNNNSNELYVNGPVRMCIMAENSSCI